MAYSQGNCFKLDETRNYCTFVVVFDPDERGWVLSVNKAEGIAKVVRVETGEPPQPGEDL